MNSADPEHTSASSWQDPAPAGRPGLPPTVRNLVIVTAAVFLAGHLLGAQFDRWLALWFPTHPFFAPWQVLTSVFMHGSVAHILFNMIGLVSFGSLLEQRWGGRRFLIFYLVCGTGAALTHMLAQAVEFQLHWRTLVEAGVPERAIESMLQLRMPIPGLPPDLAETAVELYRVYIGRMVGASGAIYGVLVAFAILYPHVRLTLLFLPIPIEARFFIPGLLVIDLLSGVTGFSIFGGGIAHFAHIGGALIGFLFMLVWRRRA